MQAEQSTDQCLFVGFQSAENSDLLPAVVDDSCCHVVFRVRVDAFQQLHPEPYQFGFYRFWVQSVTRFENLL